MKYLKLFEDYYRGWYDEKYSKIVNKNMGLDIVKKGYEEFLEKNGAKLLGLDSIEYSVSVRPNIISIKYDKEPGKNENGVEYFNILLNYLDDRFGDGHFISEVKPNEIIILKKTN